MRFPNSFLDDIRDRIPIADVIGRRVTFDRKKSNPSRGDFWACCPFHGEKTPSFHCENSKGRYHCFGCGASGDHFRFLTELDGLSFPEAVELLADEAGLPMPKQDPQEQAREDRKASLFDVMELASRFFQEQLQTSAGAKARAYLRDRGLSPQVQQTFGLGYAPDSRSALKEFLASKNVEKAQIEACGLVVYGPDIPVSYDRFRDRIMFPILDARSRVIAFGGRALSPDVPAKYLNSPETDLFSKSRVLYNFARARKGLGRDGNLIITEGYMDVIALHAAGFENAVAPLGTALTEDQIALAWKVGGEPVLCFDGDDAGLRAAFRSVDIALPQLRPGRTLLFSLLPGGKDPDDIVTQDGPEAFAELLASARPLADIVWQRATGERTFDSPERRAELEADLRQTISAIGDEAVRRHYQQNMLERTESFFGTAASRSSRTGSGRRFAGDARQRGPVRKRGFAVSDSLVNSALVKRNTALPPLRESALLVTIVNHPAVGLEHFETFADLEFTGSILPKLQTCVLAAYANVEDLEELPTLVQMKHSVEASGLMQDFQAVEQQVRQNGIWQALENAAFEDARDGWIQAVILHQRAGNLRQELKRAERAANDSGDEAAYERLASIRRELLDEAGTEALIEGFGLPSGRPARSF